MRSLLEEKIEHLTETCSCHDPVKCLRHMFVDMTGKRRVETQGQCPARRPVFLRTHGVLKGEITFDKAIPEDLRHGMFANPGAKHPVYLRYSSDLADGRPDWLSTIGLGIKIFGMPGEKVVSDNGHDTADLLFQNVPFFFVDDAKQMCEFTKSSFEGWSDEWIQRNAPATNILLDAMAKPIRSVLATDLWSVVPFRLGSSYCKYKLEPGTSTFAGDPDTDDPDFLAKDLAGRMARGDATLEIFIQKRPDPAEQGAAWVEEHFPLDRLTVAWDEAEAKPQHVATIRLPKQDAHKPGQEIYGDWLAFNIGRVPKENAPVGSIAEARMAVYQASADYRRSQNKQPVEEPAKPGQPKVENPKCPFPHQKAAEAPIPLTKDQIARICEVRIHPGIGVARVGNSTQGGHDGYYIGPEVMHPRRTAFGASRDPGGALKRQVARFRVYGYDKHGKVVAEVQHSDTAQINWSVHVSNRKAQWYEFDAAMDLPATAEISVPRRNPKVSGSGRAALCIDPGVTRISGLSMNDSSYAMNGSFQGTQVYLGELRTDPVGRLMVFPGHGVSASPSNQPVFDPTHPASFNNAAGWYDDIADGPVHATVRIGDQEFRADPAWVTSAPPNYAPDLTSWRTMDDLLRSVYITAGMMDFPKRISFARDVQPVLERMSALQWVNKGIAAMFGAEGPLNFGDDALMRKLSFAPESSLYPDPYAELRRRVYAGFRSTAGHDMDIGSWPWEYGDTYGYSNAADDSAEIAAQSYLRLPPYYDYILTRWVRGDFVSDYDPKRTHPEALDEVDLQDQPEMLDRAAMHFCLADAFHPGCELTWPMRHASMFRAPYRIRERAEGKAEPDYGATLTQTEVLRMGGPLYAQGPGDLTRWMALPWQGDTAYCRSGYDMEYDPYVPTYWPARVPNQVLTLIDYQTLCDTRRPMDERIAAFHNRPAWLRQLPSQDPAPEQMMYMIQHFGELGVLEARPRPKDMPELPEVLYVENLTEVKESELEEAHKDFTQRYARLGFHDRLLQEAGWASEEQRQEFLTIKQRGQ
ncbi:LodA/GoxA family CTQ-dependent oxidase [Sagittula sp. S175]|uniref:LodA/GoxA family CTQ-dependent oxidase n=1 Tax=Sagittula sp. S175 TaxID=3415129 RepID=UPI003C7C0939